MSRIILILGVLYLSGCQKKTDLLSPVFSPNCGLSTKHLYGLEKIRGVDAPGYKISSGDTTIFYWVNGDSSLVTGQGWSFVM